MKKVLLFALGLVAGNAAFSQNGLLQSTTNKITAVSASKSIKPKSSSNRAVTCIDTSLYTAFKQVGAQYGWSPAIRTTTTNISGAGQWFPAPQPLTIRGVVVYLATAAQTEVTTVNVNLYGSNSTDSLPGTILATKSVSVDYGGTTVNSFKKVVIFDNPITVTGPYAIGVENPSATIAVYSLRNDNGANEHLSLAKFNVWRKAQKTFQGGYNFDFLMYPIYSSDVTANFTVSDNSVCVGETVTFTNTSSPILDSKYYSYAAFYGNPDKIIYHWRLSPTDSVRTKNASHAYTTPGTYTVTLTDTLDAWTVYCRDQKSMTITVTAVPSTPSASNSTICSGSTATLTGTGSSTGNYAWYAASTGGSALATTAAFTTPSLTQTTTYYVESVGPDCSSNRVPVNVTVNPMDDATFTYSASTFCQSGNNATASVTGLTGGTFTSTTGLIINSSTGEIDVAGSTVGSYTVTYTTNGNCPNSSTTSVSVVTQPDATFSYSAAAFCSNGSTVSPQFSSGASAGNFSSTTGLTLNPSTGVITPSTSTPGTYTVTNEIPASGSCPASTKTSQVTIDAPSDPSFSYSAASFCNTGTAPAALGTGAVAGTFTSTPSGLNMNASTGEVNLATSTAGTYTVTNTTVNGACTTTDTEVIKIDTPANPTFTYSAATFCNTGTAMATLGTGAVAGTFSATPAGLSLNTTTGEVNLGTSTAGTYTVTNTAVNGACTSSDTETITVNAAPSVTAAASKTTALTNESLTFTATTTATGVTHSWNFGDNTAAKTGASVTHTYTAAGTYTVTLTSTANGCVTTKTITMTITVGTGIAEVTANVISVYPNPSTGLVTISLGNEMPVNVNVFNMVGKVVYSATEKAAKFNVDLTGNADGVYFITIQNEKFTVTKRVTLNN